MRPGSAANGILAERHYLGPARRGFAWIDDLGAIVFANPTSRRLPQDGTWLEVTRWCLYGTPNGGSQQWARAWRAVARMIPKLTTFVSYSDPSAGHTGALYRACNWLWAPTWHRLRPPPSGNGSWTDGNRQAVKDRWVFPVRRDARRFELLRIHDATLAAGNAGYAEPRRMPKL
jgi:hypothetical protein